MQLIITNLNLLGVKHNNFVYESKLIDNKMVSKIIKKLKKKNYIYKGKLECTKRRTNEGLENTRSIII